MANERKTFQSALTVGITAAAALTKHRFVGFDGNVPSANAAVLGVVQADTASGQQATVDCLGVLVVETAGAITQGAAVATDNAGKAVAHSTGEKVGWAVDAASGAGEFIRVMVK